MVAVVTAVYRYAMNEVIICALGPLATVEVRFGSGMMALPPKKNRFWMFL